MKPLAYSLQFRGTAARVSARVIEARATAPCAILDGSREDEAVLNMRLVLGSDGTFDADGRVIFAPGHELHFSTVGLGHLSPSPDPHLEHGTVILGITGGDGRFEGSEGRITSNFFISDTGELTDNQFALFFPSCASMAAAPALSFSQPSS